jgi:uncharacterized membrane protein
VSARAWFLFTLVTYAAAWVWSYLALPQRVPIHFGASGRVDQWSSRGVALLLTALLGLGAAFLFTATVRLVRRAPLSLVNVPNAEYWKRPAQVPRLRRMLGEDLWTIGAATVSLLTSVQLLLVRAAGMAHPTVAPWGWVCLGIYLVGVGVWVRWSYIHRYAVPPPDA